MDIGVVGKQTYKRSVYNLRRGNARISYTEIKNVFLSYLALSLFSVFKELTYYGAVRSQLNHFFGQHCSHFLSENKNTAKAVT